MNEHLAALRESIIAETVAAYPDFCFSLSTDAAGHLTVDCQGEWEPEPIPDPDRRHYPYLTIMHDGECFVISQYAHVDFKKYKTLKGAAKYVNDKLKASCNRRRKQKEKDDAEKVFSEKSVALLRDFQNRLAENGVESQLRLVADRSPYNYIHIDAVRIKTNLDVTVTEDYQIEIALTYQRFRMAPNGAMDIIFSLAKEGTT